MNVHPSTEFMVFMTNVSFLVNNNSPLITLSLSKWVKLLHFIINDVNTECLFCCDNGVNILQVNVVTILDSGRILQNVSTVCLWQLL